MIATVMLEGLAPAALCTTDKSRAARPRGQR